MNEPDPKKIQKCVLFNIIYYFCHRGRQNIYDFTQDQFKIGYDPDGTRYVYQAINELDKNHGIDDTLPANDAFMYEQPGKIILKAIVTPAQINVILIKVSISLVNSITQNVPSFQEIL